MKPNFFTLTGLFICIFVAVGCKNYDWDKHPVAKKKYIAKLIRHIGDNPDPLHLNYTPSVSKLRYLGIEAVEALIPMLESENEYDRLLAFTATGDAMGELINDEKKIRAIFEDISWPEDSDPEARKRVVEKIKNWVLEYKNK